MSYLVVAFRLRHLHSFTCMYRCNPVATRLQHVASAVSRLYFICEVTSFISQKPNLYVFVSVLSYF